MSVQWHRLLSQLTIWLVVEIILNLMGLDDVADYSEFVFTYSNTAIPSVTISITGIIT